MRSADPAAVTLRPVRAEDETFLYTLYCSTRDDELAAWGWDGAQRDLFLRFQFTAQRRSFETQYADADDRIICRGELPIGRWMVARGDEEIRLVDIALLPAHRGGGIGASLVRGLVAEGGERGLPIRLHVLRSSPAVGFYTRLGFSPVDDTGMYLLMECPPRR